MQIDLTVFVKPVRSGVKQMKVSDLSLGLFLIVEFRNLSNGEFTGDLEKRFFSFKMIFLLN